MRTSILLVMSVLTVALCSCDRAAPSLGEVHGTVTLSGQPVNGAIVYFKTEGVAGSAGRTDSCGQYTLRFLGEYAGAVLGENQVTVTLHDSNVVIGEEDESPAVRACGAFERTVEPGRNEFNFELTSQ